MNAKQFKEDLRKIINANSMEECCDTPDFVLADLLFHTLELHAAIYKQRKQWEAQPAAPAAATETAAPTMPIPETTTGRRRK